MKDATLIAAAGSPAEKLGAAVRCLRDAAVWLRANDQCALAEEADAAAEQTDTTLRSWRQSVRRAVGAHE